MAFRSHVHAALMGLAAFAAASVMADPTPTPTPIPGASPATKAVPLPPPPKLQSQVQPEPKKSSDQDKKKENPGKPGGKKGPDNSSKDGIDMKRFPEKFRQQFQALSAEDRARFVANWQRWKAMGEQERVDLMRKAVSDRLRMQQTIDDALKKLGLKLDKDRREVFELRYRQERRKIEEKLKSEVERQRAAMISTMLDGLRKEFSPPATSTPTPVPPAKL